jgi:YtcA family
VISVAGAQFPVWILCLIVGILVSVSLRPVFIIVGIDEWMTPRPLIYSCLALVVAFISWLLVWR